MMPGGRIIRHHRQAMLIMLDFTYIVTFETIRWCCRIPACNGALNDSDTMEIRKRLIQKDKVEAIIVLPRDLFITTDISVTLWILNQNKKAVIIMEKSFVTVSTRSFSWIYGNGEEIR